MSLELSVSDESKIKKTLSDGIIFILSREFPLTIGEITKRIKKHFKINPTFQAVRKAILALKERKIILLNSNLVSINKEYILEEKKLTDQLLASYFSLQKDKKSALFSEDAEHSTYFFENLIQADSFWSELVIDWQKTLKKGDDYRFFFYGPHCWYPFGHLGLERDFLMQLRGNDVKLYYLVGNDFPLDKWIGKFYKSLKVNYKTKNEKNSTRNKIAMGIFGDFVIQFEYPKETYDLLNKIFKNSKNLESINLSELANVLKRNSKIKFTILRNNLIADNLKKEILNNFKVN